MPFDSSTHGVFRIDGQWATSIGFRLHQEDGETRQVDLRFNNDGTRIAKLTLSADQARALLGERNFENLAAASTVDAPAKGQDPGVVTRSGRLHGESLAYRETVWHAPVQETENSLGPTPPARTVHDERARDREPGLTARDAVVGTAHLGQLTGLGGPGVHAATQALGTADAAKVAADLAQGEKVRPIDAAAAAASVAMGTGAGGDAVQTAAKAVAAGAAIDTAQRAANTAQSLTYGAAIDDAPASKEQEDERLRRRALRSAVPYVVTQRFVQVKDEYYFPDRTLAFTDHGGQLKSNSENLEVIRSLVAIAEAREWWSVTVSGSEQFRREVWREGVRQGIEVHGYSPSEVERAQMRQSLGMPEAHGKAHTSGAPPHPEKDRDRDSDATTADAKGGKSSQQVTGVLLSHGAAPYRFDASNGVSYQATVRTQMGERTLWGVDLERAIVESQSGVKIGDEVTIESRGSAAIQLKVPRRDEAGAVIGHEEIATHRNSWTVETTQHLAERHKAAETFRREAPVEREAAHANPQLLNAMVGLWLSEQFADRYISEPADRERMVGQVKARLAQALERGESITAPQLKREMALGMEGANEPTSPAKRARHSHTSAQHALSEPPYVHLP